MQLAVCRSVPEPKAGGVSLLQLHYTTARSAVLLRRAPPPRSTVARVFFIAGCSGSDKGQGSKSSGSCGFIFHQRASRRPTAPRHKKHSTAERERNPTQRKERRNDNRGGADLARGSATRFIIGCRVSPTRAQKL